MLSLPRRRSLPEAPESADVPEPVGGLAGESAADIPGEAASAEPEPTGPTAESGEHAEPREGAEADASDADDESIADAEPIAEVES